jgi:hypothetical protein
MTVATLTLAALERVKVKHPVAASGDVAPSAVSDARASEIWRVLLSVDGTRLRGHVVALPSANVRLALYGAATILTDDGVLERLAAILDLRGDLYQRRSPVAWIALLLSDGDTRFKAAAEAYLGTRPDVRYWHSLSATPRPLTALLQDYLGSNTAFDDWWASPRIALSRYHALESALLRRLLLSESFDTLLTRETLATIDRWMAAALSESERVEWHQRYVTHSNPSRWRPTDTFLERILSRYRTPEDGHSFWAQVAEPRQRAFVRWLRDRELTSLLGEGERVEFWRRFLADVVRSMESADGAAVFIVFPTWFAVQFKEMGKATYFLSRDHLIAARRLAASQLYRYVLDHTPLGRYTHHGGYWQYTAQREVRRIMDAASQQ